MGNIFSIPAVATSCGRGWHLPARGISAGGGIWYSGAPGRSGLESRVPPEISAGHPEHVVGVIPHSRRSNSVPSAPHQSSGKGIQGGLALLLPFGCAARSLRLGRCPT